MTAFGSTLTDLGNALAAQQQIQLQGVQGNQRAAIQMEEQNRLRDRAALEAALSMAALEEDKRQANLGDALNRFQITTRDNQVGNDLAFRGRQLESQTEQSALDRALREQLEVADLSIRSAQVGNNAAAAQTQSEVEREKIAAEKDLLGMELEAEKEKVRALQGPGGVSRLGIFGNDIQYYRQNMVRATAAANRANTLSSGKKVDDSLRSSISRNLGNDAGLIEFVDGKWVPSPSVFGAGQSPALGRALNPSSGQPSAQSVLPRFRVNVGEGGEIGLSRIPGAESSGPPFR